MSDIKVLSPDEIKAIFSPLGHAEFDVSGIHRKFIDCPYGEENRQLLDIYLPNEGEGPFPVIIFAHGGGWTGGNKSDAQALSFIGGVERGYAVVLLTYRLVPGIRYPQNLFDIKAALRWLAENGDSYLLDTDRVALTGASAGAHLAMMSAFTMGQPAFEGAPLGKTCNIRCVVNQYGPTDLTAFHRQYDESGFARADDPNSGSPTSEELLTGFKVSEHPGLEAFINPIANVHPGMPPVLTQHGLYDPIVPYQQATELTDKIIAVAGEDKAELDLQEKYSHADLGFASPAEVNRIFAFLDKYLK